MYIRTSGLGAEGATGMGNSYFKKFRNSVFWLQYIVDSNERTGKKVEKSTELWRENGWGGGWQPNKRK